jgi:hypothetical protein
MEEWRQSEREQSQKANDQMEEWRQSERERLDAGA